MNRLPQDAPMFNCRSVWLRCLPWFLLLQLTACATVPTLPPQPPQAYLAEQGDDELLARHAPVFIVDEPQYSHNRIGTPAARIDEEGEVEILVDAERPAIYAMRQEFATTSGAYTNLIYRIHFEQVPFSLMPFHLTAGRNVGLLVIVTLNDQQRPVLITTDHTCGCYLSFTTTQHTPPQAWPEGFRPDERQDIYGESLPGRLDLSPETRLLIRLRPDTHRVMELATANLEPENAALQLVPTPLLPLDGLERLPLGDATTSFFETQGSRRGYVRQSHKPWERLLMSWWAFDWRVGEDKKYMPAGCETVFYTSLKFWSRKHSDLCDFAGFLAYWGWKL